VQRREQRAQGDTTESALLDAVVSVAADLRAGQPAASGYARIRAVSGAARPGSATPLVDLVEQRVGATIRLADASGAPLADLLDRLEADLRARRAIAQHGAAQAAGATATGWLLTLLPFAGVGLGYALGVDPARQLLHTPLGAGCVIAALVLQLGGLLWVARIARLATELGG
jgi:tight adherence protein B